MGIKPGRGKRLTGAVKLLSKALLQSTAVCVTLLMSVAKAAELQPWRYDGNTGALTITLPETVVPQISVIAPDQLLLELADTQVGDITGQAVRDGLVDTISLEQTDADTVWMVMEFAAGTVLADTQQAVPVSETASGEQQWQIQPAILATRQTSPEPIASQPTPGADASSLRTPTATLSQLPELDNLPVLEPAVPTGQTVSVPPLEPVPAAPQPAPLPPAPAVPAPADSVPEAASVPTRDAVASEPNESSTPSVEIIQSETALEAPAATSSPTASESTEIEEETGVAVEVIPADTQPSLGSAPAAASEPPAPIEAPVETVAVPDEPPFLGDLNTQPAEPPTSVAVEEAPVAEDVIAVDPGPASAIAAEPVSPNPQTAVITAETDTPPGSGRIVPTSASRWPEPIPFGTPLPTSN